MLAKSTAFARQLVFDALSMTAALDFPAYDPSALANEAEQKLNDVIKQVQLCAPSFAVKIKSAVHDQTPYTQCEDVATCS